MKASREGHRRRMSLERRRGLWGYLFVLPFIIGLVLFFSNWVINSLIFSFSDVVVQTGNARYTLEPVGFAHYARALFVDPDFVRTEVETIGKLLIQIVIVIIYALFIAVVLNQKMRCRGLVRAIFFLPVILATGIMSKVEMQNTMINGSTLIGQMGTDAAISGGAAAGLREDYTGMFDIVSLISSLNLNADFMNIVFGAVSGIYDIIKYSGVQMVIFLAGLQSISPSIYEAARVEGCTGWESFWKITLPMISPLTMVCTVWTIVEYFLNPANPIMEKIFGAGMSKISYGLSSAMAWLNFLAMGLLVLIVFAVLRRFVFYETK